MKAEEIKKELFTLGTPEKANTLSRFFKCGSGEYGEGDQFIGVVVPQQRALVKKYKQIDLKEIEKLINDTYHECRLTGLLFLVAMFHQNKEEKVREKIYTFYIGHFNKINNWDLVDLTSRDIVGSYLFDKSREPLYQFAQTDHLWTQRIAIVSTYYFIRKKQFDDTFAISDL
ncbi:MAG: DNA alkylation repair protein, partial [Bacteroidales bacterium]